MICLDGSQFLQNLPNRIVMKRSRKTRRQSAPAVVGLTLLLILFTVLMGIGLAQAIEPKSVPAAELLGKPMVKEAPKPESIGTVDPLSDRERAGQALYLENCASCHLGIPPAVMPTQTWQALLQDPQHYGISIELPQDPERRILWNYVKTASRPTASASDRVPYRIAESRYMRALHPKVKFTEKQGLTTCISCHPSAKDFNFRKLTPEAENSP
jgi:mono/diheme cytochrome c family protein